LWCGIQLIKERIDNDDDDDEDEQQQHQQQAIATAWFPGSCS
jgi:hypothetical protein